MQIIFPARAANVATHACTKLYSEIMSSISGVYESRHDWLYLKRPQPMSIYFVSSVSGLPLMVGRSTNHAEVSTRALTSVVFAPGRRGCTQAVTCFVYEIDLREIFDTHDHKVKTRSLQ